MKAYWEIPGFSKAPREHCFAFMKYDGSNMRFEWSKKRGWYKFGTRRTMFERGDEQWGNVIDVFENNYAEDLEKTFKDNKNFRNTQIFTVFCEYFGANSFAGQHQPDDKMELVLFDVNVHKKGIVLPKDFMKHFGHLKIAELVYEGNFNTSFIEDVKSGKYGDGEGIVAKGVLSRSKKEQHGLWMTKVKTNTWFEKLRSLSKTDESLKKVLGDNEKEQFLMEEAP